MYSIQALLLTKDDLWSKGAVQQVYLNDTETALLFCLGVMTDDHWEPLRVQGKVAYAYRSETYAQEICANQSYVKSHHAIAFPQDVHRDQSRQLWRPSF